VILAPDPGVPQRDALLDPARIAAVFGADRAERVNAKYRVGESLRVAYRLHMGGRTHTVAGRTFTGRSARVYSRAAAGAVPAQGLPGVVHAPDLETVFWAFPNDRRLAALKHLAELDALVGQPVAATELVAYAPERAATLKALDEAGRVLAFVKLHWDAAEREHAAAKHASDAIGPDDPLLRLPRVLAARGDALALEPLAGERLDGVDHLVPALHRLGAALARLHAIEPPARRFDRVDPHRLEEAARVIAAARPDCADAAHRLLERLGSAPEGEPVHLHGDTNLRNALLDGRRIALVDLEDAAAGPAAADIGFVVAGLLAAHAQRRITAARRDALEHALLSGYGAPVPGLGWHVAAAVLARIAVPAVGRVRPVALAHLEPLLTAAA
jgi:Phosphotransferase enzyme family